MRRLIAAASAAVAAAVAGCSSAGHDGQQPSGSSSPSGVRLSSSSASVAPRAQRIEASGPVGLTVAGSTVWTVEASAGAVVARDARTGRLLHRVQVGDTPLRASYDGEAVWVSVFGAGRVVAIDPRSGKIVHRVRLGGQPEGIAAAFGAVWVVRQAARRLTRLAPDGRVGRSYRLGSEPRLVAAGESGLFVADVTDGTLTRIDPHSGRRTVSRKICDGAQDVAASAGSVWVTCTRSDRIVAVDEKTLLPTATLHVPGEPDGARIVGSTLYVVAAAGPTIYRIRIGSHPAIESKQVLGKAFALDDRANVDLAVAADRVWVTSYGENRLIGLSR